jgi:hypothetical protein
MAIEHLRAKVIDYAKHVTDTLKRHMREGYCFSLLAAASVKVGTRVPCCVASTSSNRSYLVVATTLEAGTGAAPRARAFLKHCVRWRAAKSAPKAKRMSGPKLFAAAIPTK